MWMEVFRYNGNGWDHGIDPRNNITLPDYIEAHNTADLAGAFSLAWSTIYDDPWHRNGSFTRYCIEMQVVELHNVTTPTDWVPATSQFADYASCQKGQCLCMKRIDREGCGQPQDQVLAQCGDAEPGHIPEHLDNSTQESNCAVERQAESEKYNGMDHKSWNQPPAGGTWYSMPPGGYCVPGAQVGDAGCTYRVSPLSHSLSLGNLYSKGVFNENTGGTHQWLQSARAAFDDLGVESCSGVANAIHEQIIMA
jgi:hypothetical protein